MLLTLRLAIWNRALLWTWSRSISSLIAKCCLDQRLEIVLLLIWLEERMTRNVLDRILVGPLVMSLGMSASCASLSRLVRGNGMVYLVLAREN